MSKKSLAIIIAAMMMCIMFTGCTEELSAPSSTAVVIVNTAQPTLAPTPEPKVGLDAVFDKEEITIVVISNGSEADSALFFEGAQREAQSMGVNLITVDAQDGFVASVSETAQDGADAMIAYLAEPPISYSSLAAAADEGLPICIFEMQKGNVPANVSHVYYNPNDAESLAFNAAIVYPPHETPVRLILMFESRETNAYATFEQLFGEGKIFPKEIYIAAEDEDNAPKEWLEKRLEDYIEGMLDGVFAENAALAIGAVDALETLGRTDMEVFSIDLTPDTAERMSKNPEVFAQTVGPNTVLAGALSVRASLNALAGGGFVSLELMPSLFSADDFGPDIFDTLAGIDDTLSALYNEDWMDTLREYYKK